jgi:SHS2 domain-containing protein
MPYTPLSHTADTGLEATAPDLGRLIVEMATGMFELMATVDPCPDEWQHFATIEARSNEDLVVDCLSELLYMSEIEDTHFCRFEVSESGESEVTVKMAGVPTSSIELTGPPIKAVTYHALEVTERDDGWYGRVYFDV